MAVGIGEQVADDLGEEVGVDANSPPTQLSSLGRLVRLRGGEVAKEYGDLYLSQLKANALVEAGKHEQVVDQPLHPSHLLQRHGLDTAYILGARTVVASKNLELSTDRGEGTAQLVGRIRYKPPLLCECSVEAIEHVVERLGQGAQLLGICGFRIEPRRQVAGINLGGGRGKPP